MATEREIWQLEYRADTSDLREADAALQRVYASLGAVDTGFAQAASSGTVFSANTSAASVNLKQLDKDADLATAALKRQADAAEQAGSATARATNNYAKNGRALMEIGRVADDVQYGLRGIVNNMEGLTLALGGSAGLAGAITIAAVALNIFGPKIVDFFKGLGDQTEPINDLIERLKAMGDEASEIARKAQSASFQIRSAFRLPENVEAGQRFGQTLAEGDFEAARPALVAREADRAEMFDAEIRGLQTEIDNAAGLRMKADQLEQMAATRPDLTPAGRARLRAQADDLRAQADERGGAANLARNRARQRIRRDAVGTVEGLAQQAASGNANAQAQLIAGLRDTGRGDLADRLARITPEAIREERDAEEEAEFQRRNLEADAKRAQWEQEQEKLRQELADRERIEEEQGEENRLRKLAEDAEWQKSRAAQAALQARADASRFGVGLDAQAQFALAQGADQDRVAQQAAKAMAANGLDADRAGAAGQALVEGAQEALNAEIAAWRNMGASRDQAIQQVLAEMFQAIQKQRQEAQQNAFMFGGMAEQIRAMGRQPIGGGPVFQPRVR